jgi:putative transposase
MPHHVTLRGNRRQQTFFGEEDYQHYLELISRFCRAEQVAIWTYCLMPNHVHLIDVPQSAESLRRAIGEAHRRYTRRINFREGWRGHLWQGRFASFVMGEEPPDRGAVRGDQPRARRVGPGTKPLSLEQRGGSPERA